MIKITPSTDQRRLGADGIVLTAHQPEFMPWLGYISKAVMSDAYFVLDSVQFVKDVFQNRNKIRIKSNIGWQWLTVPVLDVKKHLLNWTDVRIDNSQHWKTKHLNSIYYSYAKANYFDIIYNDIEKIYQNNWDFLIDFIVYIREYTFKKFNIHIPVYRTTDLIEQGYDISGQKTDLIINMCKVIEADNFVFGSVARTYVDKEKLNKANIQFYFQNFKHPTYNQIQGEFIPNMSFIDLLFNYGDESVNILNKSKGDLY